MRRFYLILSLIMARLYQNASKTMIGPKVATRKNISRIANRVISREISREVKRLGFRVAVGFAIGFLLSTLFRCAFVTYSLNYCPLSSGRFSHSLKRTLFCGSCQGPKSDARTEEPERSKYYTDENLVLVAVITAKEFLKTRVAAIHNTWAKSIPGEVIFFSSEGSDIGSPPGINVIGLRGVDDTYPPQKKTFMMLKYIHDHYLHRFRFFIRADDDVYIKGEALLKFLHSVNSTGVPVIGKTGLGNKEELGKMYLRANENYCMGGPGMIMTSEILAKTVPHIRHCLNNLYTTHEDVEVGRCIKQFANVTCTWSYQGMFYHNFAEPKGSFTHSLRTKDIQRAITLHPVKSPTYTYRLHQYVLGLKTASLRNRLKNLQQQIDALNSLLKSNDRTETASHPSKRVPVNNTIQRTTDDVIEWDFVSSKHLYSSRYQNPELSLLIDQRIGQKDVYDEIFEIMNTTQKNMIYSFASKHPLYGLEQVLGIDTKHRKPRQLNSTGNTIKQVFVRRPFVEVEFREDNRFIHFESANPKNSEHKFHRADSNERVNFILSLVGRFSTFLRFMQNFEDVCLKRHENVSLTIMLFRNDPNDTSADIITYVTRLKQMYNDTSIDVFLMNGSFSRGVALQNASRRFREDDLLFFIDVDLEVQSSTLLRIRLNTAKGQTVYAPIFFSLYDPQYLSPNISNQYMTDAGDKFDLDRGYWRQQSFGMISTYKNVFDRAGGFREDINGWGSEDVDLLEKFISAKVNVFRSVDVGLLHRFHPIICDLTLEKKQLKMCMGTKVITSTSTGKMADIVRCIPEIFYRNIYHPENSTTESHTHKRISQRCFFSL